MLPKKSWTNVCVMSLSHFTSDFFCNVLPIMLPILALRYDISYSQCAALFMVFSVATSFLQPPIGILADKKSVNYLMPLSILTGGIFACLISYSPNIYVLIFIVLLSGICSSAFHPISAGIVYNICPKNHQSFATSLYIAGGNIGFALAPVLIAWFIDIFSDKSLPYLSILAIVVTLLIYKQRLHCSRTQNLVKKNDISLKELIKSKEFIFLNTSVSLRSWCYCALVTFLPLLLTNIGYSSVQSGAALMCLLLGTVAGGLVVGSLADRFGLRFLIVCSYVITFISCLYFLTHINLSFMSMMALFLTGAGMYGSTPAAIVWSQKLMPQNASFAAAMMLGFTFGMGYVESVITGFIGDYFGLQCALLVTLLPALILATITIFLVKEPK